MGIAVVSVCLARVGPDPVLDHPAPLSGALANLLPIARGSSLCLCRSRLISFALGCALAFGFLPAAFSVGSAAAGAS